MNQSEFGESAFLLYISGPLVSVLSLGMYVPLIRDTSNSKTPAKETPFVSTTLYFAYTLGIILVIACSFQVFNNFIALLLNIKTHHYEKIVLLSSIVGSGIIHLYIYSAILASGKVKHLSLYTTFRLISSNILSIVFVLYCTGISDKVVSRFLGFAVGDIFTALIYSKYILLRISNRAFNPSYFRSLLVPGLSISLIGLGTLLATTVERATISRFLGDDVLAVYSLATIITIPVSVLVASIQSVLTPTYHTIGSLTVANRLILRTIGSCFPFVLLLALGLYVFVLGALSINIFPRSYAGVAALVIPMSITAGLTGMHSILSNYFVKVNNTLSLCAVTLTAALFSCIMFVILIPIFGIYASITVNLLTNMIVFCALFKLFYSNRLSRS